MLWTKPANHLKQYTNIALLLWRYGRSDLVKNGALRDYLPDESSDDKTHEGSNGELADNLAADIEKMGPTYIKFGQLLSTRPDLISPEGVKALTRLQDKVAPFDFGAAEKILASELGVRLSRAFQEIDPRPIAAASLGQVHRAVLRDGRQVAVKIQRPDIREHVREDLEVLEEIAELLDKHTEAGRRADFTSLALQFRKTLLRELDYRQEAENLILLGKNLAAFDKIVVPRPVEDYSTSRVLTMEYVHGQKITALSPVVRLDINGEELAEQLFKAYLQQILVDGFFHADPHPGNVFLTQDNRIALIDLGMAAYLSADFQEGLLPMVIDLSEGRGDSAVEFALRHGQALDDFDEKEFRRKIGELTASTRDNTMQQMHMGALLMEIRRIAGQSGIQLPAELSLIGKTLLNLDEIGRTLAPQFDPQASIRRNAAALTQRRFWKSFAQGNLFSRALELRQLAQHLPQRLGRIVDLIANNELKINVDAIDERYLMTGMQKVANRITLGLILAALIVGAALLMRVDTPFRILGYPGLAILLFLLAALGGCAFMFHILFHDETNTGRH